MIFVTVGTTLPFDRLIEQIDQLRCGGSIRDRVFCQIGTGTYEPRYCEFARFLPSINRQIEQASLVIGHGGTGTTLDLIQRQKPFIAVANPKASDAHQERFLERLAEAVNITWAKNVEDLAVLINNPNNNMAPHIDLPRLAPSIVEYIDSLV